MFYKQIMGALLDHIYNTGNLELIMLLLEKDLKDKIDWNYINPKLESATVLTAICKIGGTLACNVLEKLLSKNIEVNKLINGYSAIALVCRERKFDLLENFYQMTDNPKKTIGTIKLVLRKMESDKTIKPETTIRLQAILVKLESNSNKARSELTFSNMLPQNTTSLESQKTKLVQGQGPHAY